MANLKLWIIDQLLSTEYCQLKSLSVKPYALSLKLRPYYGPANI